jgi:hypothetical protein
MLIMADQSTGLRERWQKLSGVSFCRYGRRCLSEIKKAMDLGVHRPINEVAR